MGLETYQKMRDFRRTPEPRGRVSKTNRRRFVVQEHHASKLHFDFRLEMGGVLKSWSVPRGPSLDPTERRLAVETEDHPVEYLKFEGQIPAGEYGAGEHMRWDGGTYKLLGEGDANEQLEHGKLEFELHGERLRGAFTLVRMKGREGEWLLIKKPDEFAEAGWQLRLRKPVGGQETIEAKSGKKAEGRRQKAEGGSTDGAKGARGSRDAGEEGVRKFDTEKETRGQPVVPVGRALKAGELKGDLNVRVGREVVPLTSLERVYWPDEGYTKGDLIRYYYEVSKYILPYLEDRPLIMKRYPAGIRGQFFHQHDVNEVPDFVRTVALEVEDGGGHRVDYIVGTGHATLLYMANLGAIERHPWHSRVGNLDHPDWFVFDLDPGEGVEFKTICEVALSTRDVLEQLGLESYAKTSGSRGIHVYVPVKAIYGYEEIAELAELVATAVARRHSDVATVERSKRKRGRRMIYVDHMQNARGKSVVAPYSVRPKPGATVSAPLEWTEVERKKIRTDDFDIKNMSERIGRKGDLFKPVLKRKQALGDALEKARELLADSRARGARA
ncbi:MAG: non-homologous end-joining DNA ligase [Acidobacteriota bacterium]|nr:non-homologous end-joining DNA ligase [Acidobacteriota bacterium]MDQ5838378.1 non-homologous end-joining DNA ligase [Acidobacteriota bacterium]